MMNRAQPAFAPPPWSLRRKLSIINMITHVMNMIQAKKTNIVQITSQNV